jgi:hypothetical protein
MSTHRSKDRSSLCSFTFVDGSHCRIPRQAGHPYICAFHACKEAQSLAGQDIDSVSAGSTFYPIFCDCSLELSSPPKRHRIGPPTKYL